MYEDYTYIVTGCTGFVGNVLTKKLLNDGARVIGFARNEKKVERIFSNEKENSNFSVVYGDITDESAVEKLFSTICGNGEKTVVIHTVAKVSIGESSYQELYDVTVNGAKNVVERCLKYGVAKLFQISSTEALPKGFDVTKELTNYIPDPETKKKGYGKAKSLADKIAYDAYKEKGLNVSFLTFASVIGPGDYTKGHMAQLMINYIEGKLPASIRGGYNDFDIRDVAEVLPKIIENSKSGEAYIFANKPDKINDVLDAIREKYHTKKLISLPLWVAYMGIPFLAVWSKITRQRPLYTSSALKVLTENSNFSIEKVKREFGYSPRPLKETVCDEIKFFIENGMVHL